MELIVLNTDSFLSVLKSNNNTEMQSNSKTKIYFKQRMSTRGDFSSQGTFGTVWTHLVVIHRECHWHLLGGVSVVSGTPCSLPPSNDLAPNVRVPRLRNPNERRWGFRFSSVTRNALIERLLWSRTVYFDISNHLSSGLWVLAHSNPVYGPLLAFVPRNRSLFLVPPPASPFPFSFFWLLLDSRCYWLVRQDEPSKMPSRKF